MNNVHAKAGMHENYWAIYEDDIKMDSRETECEYVKRIFSEYIVVGVLLRR